jgi:hypothetical protein
VTKTIAVIIAMDIGVIIAVAIGSTIGVIIAANSAAPRIRCR